MKFTVVNAFIFSTLLLPHAALAQDPGAGVFSPASLSAATLDAQQSNVPAPVKDAENAVERAAKRFRLGVEGGVGVDPELIMFGGHGTFGPFFTRGLDFRPGVEFGIGEVTTTFGVNLDLLYTLPGATRTSRWVPYVGAGPNFALSHRGFETQDADTGVDDGRSRFNFSDTDFESGLNFIAGARHRNGMFMEMKATAYGVSNVRLMVGYNF